MLMELLIVINSKNIWIRISLCAGTSFLLGCIVRMFETWSYYNKQFLFDFQSNLKLFFYLNRNNNKTLSIEKKRRPKKRFRFLSNDKHCFFNLSRNLIKQNFYAPSVFSWVCVIRSQFKVLYTDSQFSGQ